MWQFRCSIFIFMKLQVLQHKVKKSHLAIDLCLLAPEQLWICYKRISLTCCCLLSEISHMLQVQKFLKKGEKGFVVFAGDTRPIEVMCHLPIMCEDADVPYCYVPAKQVSLPCVDGESHQSDVWWLNILVQHGPTAFDLQAILQKRDNLQAMLTKWCIKQKVHKI